MKRTSTPKKSKAAANPALLRVLVKDFQLCQMQEYLDLNDPQRSRGLIINFLNARLSDVNDTEIFRGFISVRTKAVISVPSMHMVGRIMNPFKGLFMMVVEGTYAFINNGSLVEVQADEILTVNIQPDVPNKSANRDKIVPT